VPLATTRVLEIEGGASAATVAEQLGVALEGRGAQTVGGLLIHALGRIPRTGERFAYQGLEFDILAASVTRVERVAVRQGPVRLVPLDRPEEHA
jgi:CBS domain containing-hemolysin-like protein